MIYRSQIILQGPGASYRAAWSPRRGLMLFNPSLEKGLLSSHKLPRLIRNNKTHPGSHLRLAKMPGPSLPPDATAPPQSAYKIEILPATHVPLSISGALLNPTHPVTAVWSNFILYGSPECNTRQEILYTFPELTRFQFFAILSPRTSPGVLSGGPTGISSKTVSEDKNCDEDDCDTNISRESDAWAGNTICVAMSNAVPFHWENPNDEKSLPDEGWMDVIRRGTEQYLNDQSPKTKTFHAPNALSALAVAVDPAYRNINRQPRDGEVVQADLDLRNTPIYTYLPEDLYSSNTNPQDMLSVDLTSLPTPTPKYTDLATAMITAMKDSAIKAGFEAMVVPLRPTYKSRHPTMDMEKYIQLKKPGANGEERTEVYDPWVRKHLGLGARIVKLCPRSWAADATVEKWKEWTGVDFDSAIGKASSEENEEGKNTESGEHENGRYVDVVFPGGLVPLRVDRVTRIGTYVEPNVWVRHF